MFNFRFSLLHFLIVITLLAVGFAALVSGSRIAASGAYSLYLALICLALAGAIAIRGERRPFWIGFAVFGWAYFLFAFDSGSQSPQRNWSSLWLSGIAYNYYGSESPSGAHLITTEVIDFLEEHLTGNRDVGSKVMAQWSSGSYYAGTIQSYDGTIYIVAWDDGSTPSAVTPAGIKGYTPYIRLSGHSIFGALAGLIGGIITALVFASKQENHSKS